MSDLGTIEDPVDPVDPAPTDPVIADPVDPPSDPAPSDTWRTGIAEGPLLEQANRYTSPTAAIQANVDMRKKLSTAVVIPGEGATDEERADFNTKMGVPTSTDDYQINLPEGLDASIVPSEEATAGLKQSLEGMRTAGASQAVINEGLALHFNALQVSKQAEIDADAAFTKETMSILEKEWGPDLDENKAIATNAAPKIFGEHFEEARQIEMKDGRFLMDHPVMMRMLANMGREIGDSVLGGVISTEQRASIMEQADDVRAKRNEALSKGNTVLAQQLDEQERTLLAKAG